MSLFYLGLVGRGWFLSYGSFEKLENLLNIEAGEKNYHRHISDIEVSRCSLISEDKF